jgi:hypothetical protein
MANYGEDKVTLHFPASMALQGGQQRIGFDHGGGLVRQRGHPIQDGGIRIEKTEALRFF